MSSTPHNNIKTRVLHFRVVVHCPQVYLLVYWVVCSGVAVLAVWTQVQDQQAASTAVRKTFHLLMLAVYLPGLAWECTLMYLASGIAFAALITLEVSSHYLSVLARKVFYQTAAERQIPRSK